MFRQGDVLIEPLPAGTRIPDGASAVPRDQGRVVLAYGERTGHAHAIHDEEALLLAFGDERFLKLGASVMLRHEEHDAIPLPAGDYEVIQQREYSPEAIRNVRD
jgi:hypothetical protein